MPGPSPSRHGVIIDLMDRVARAVLEAPAAGQGAGQATGEPGSAGPKRAFAGEHVWAAIQR